MNAALQLNIEQRCLRSVRACRSLRRQMTAPELLRAYDAEMTGERRHKVLMLLAMQHCRVVRAERLARIARVKPKPTRVRTRRAYCCV
jgi:hypothetical protein